MGNTMPPRASREAAGSGRRGAGTGRRRSAENVVVVTEVVPPATPSRRVQVATARKQGRDDDDDDVEEGTTRAGGSSLLREGGAAPGLGPPAGTLLTVKIVMRRKDAEALVARLKLKARGARQRRVRMAELKGELRAGTRSCGGGGASRDARSRTTLPPIKENQV